MQFGMDDETAARVDALVEALDRQAESNRRLAAAIETANEYHDASLNGPRG